MKATIYIQMDNAAFEDENAGLELADILEDLAKHIRGGDTERRLSDCNGNYVGTFKITGLPRRRGQMSTH